MEKLPERIFEIQQKELGIEAEVLPSTSPANAAYSVERLVGIWKEKIGEM